MGKIIKVLFIFLLFTAILSGRPSESHAKQTITMTLMEYESESKSYLNITNNPQSTMTAGDTQYLQVYCEINFSSDHIKFYVQTRGVGADSDNDKERLEVTQGSVDTYHTSTPYSYYTVTAPETAGEYKASFFCYDSRDNDPLTSITLTVTVEAEEESATGYATSSASTSTTRTRSISKVEGVISTAKVITFPSLGSTTTDADGDGYASDVDCDDTITSGAGIYPGATETCGDSIDQDCDGLDTACSVEEDTDDDDDTVLDESDNCSLLANTDQLDTDTDGMGDVCDDDDDGDGVADASDPFSLDSTEWLDTDSDGTGNNADTDDDADTVLDVDDVFPIDATEWVDSDGDGTGDNSDTETGEAATEASNGGGCGCNFTGHQNSDPMSQNILTLLVLSFLGLVGSFRFRFFLD